MGKKKKRKAKATIISAKQKNLTKRLLLLWKSLPKLAKWGFEALVFVLGALVLYPSISVHPQDYRIADDPASGIFVLANNNLYPIFNIRCDYFLDSAIFESPSGDQFAISMNTLDSNTNMPMYFSVSKIEAKKEQTFDIQSLRMHGLRFAEMRIMVTYYVFGIKRVDMFSYQTFKNYAGVTEWMPATYDLPSIAKTNR